MLPVKPGSKSPGSVVGESWDEKSSRDPNQIPAWWSDNPNYGIAAALRSMSATVLAGSNEWEGRMPWPDVEPMTGIEPAYSAWEADVLPLNYIGAVAPEG